MKLAVAALLAAVCAGWIPLVGAQENASVAPVPQEERVVFPASVSQGALVFGKVPPGSEVRFRERLLRTTGYGTVVFGVGRDEAGPLSVAVTTPSGRTTLVMSSKGLPGNSTKSARLFTATVPLLSKTPKNCAGFRVAVINA